MTRETLVIFVIYGSSAVMLAVCIWLAFQIHRLRKQIDAARKSGDA